MLGLDFGYFNGLEWDLQIVSNLLISVDNVSKCFRRFSSPQAQIKQAILSQLPKQIRPDLDSYCSEFWAVRNVSFEVKRGETIGIIGRNGSGKSTLLRMISGVTNPSLGVITSGGRISALLELGAGFNPDFTGRENVYTYGMVLGLSQDEINSRFKEIVDFSGIGRFIDEQIKTYSSGMVAKLAFSVAVQVQPDVLIVDEALSVGDMAFQEKSYTKMKQIRNDGAAILFVSHSLPAVRNFCQKAIWLDGGEIKKIGERIEVCDAYQEEMNQQVIMESQKDLEHLNATKSPEIAAEKIEKRIEIGKVFCNKPEYLMDEDIIISIPLKFFDSQISYGVGIILYDRVGRIVSLINTLRDDVFLKGGRDSITLHIKGNHFSPGAYRGAVIISDECAMFPYDRLDDCIQFHILTELSQIGLPRVEGALRCTHDWIL